MSVMRAFCRRDRDMFWRVLMKHYDLNLKGRLRHDPLPRSCRCWPGPGGCGGEPGGGGGGTPRGGGVPPLDCSMTESNGMAVLLCSDGGGGNIVVSEKSVDVHLPPPFFPPQTHRSIRQQRQPRRKPRRAAQHRWQPALAGRMNES